MMTSLIDFISSLPSYAIWIALTVGFIILDFALKKRRLRKLAQNTHSDIQKLYKADAFRWEVTNLSSFSKIDLAFYQKTTDDMKSLGYTNIADIELLHISDTYPEMRTPLRLYATQHGQIMVAAYHLRVRGWKGLVALVLMGGRNHKVVEFQSALSDGRFVCSTTAAKVLALSNSDQILKYDYARTTPLASLLQAHIANVKKFCTTDPSVVPLVANTLEQIIALEEKQHLLQHVHRSNLGTLTKEELKNIAPKISEKDRSSLHDELVKLKTDQ